MTEKLYISDEFGDDDTIKAEDQDFNNVRVHLNIPNLKNCDGVYNRPKSNLMVRSVDETIIGKETFPQAIVAVNGTHNNELVTKSYVDTGINSCLKTDGSNKMLGEIDMGNRKIVNVSYGFSQNDAANVQNLNVGLARKPDINQVILRDGSQLMNANLDMANYKIKILVLLKLIQMPLIKIFLTMKEVKNFHLQVE